MIHRRDTLRAEKKYYKTSYLKKVKDGNIKIEWNHQIKEVVGDDMGVTGGYD